MGARRNEANLSRPREISLRSETKNPSQIDFCNFCGPSSVEVGDFSSVHLFRPILVLLANFWSFYSHISENSALKKKNIPLRIQKHIHKLSNDIVNLSVSFMVFMFLIEKNG